MAAEGGVLVIGYGNSLRGDDAVGRLVAEEVASWQRPNVAAISVTQLLPELAQQVAAARVVIFVDACADEDVASVSIRKLSLAPIASNATPTHFAAATDILRLAQSCFGHAPPAWLVAIAAREFGLTEEVSPATRQNIAPAIDAVRQLVDQAQSGKSVSHFTCRSSTVSDSPLPAPNAPLSSEAAHA